MHFSSVLLICILVLMPTHTRFSLSTVLCCLGAAGLVYSIRQWIRVFWTLRSKSDLADRIFYVFIPNVGYFLVICSRIMMVGQSWLGAEVMAVALVVLLLAGIRNAWDMAAWIITRSQKWRACGGSGNFNERFGGSAVAPARKFLQIRLDCRDGKLRDDPEVFAFSTSGVTPYIY